MGLFNWKKRDIVKQQPKNIQQEMMDYVDIYGNPQIVDDYIKNTLRPAFGSRLDYDKAKAVLGVIAMAEKDKKLALAKYETLIKWWLVLDEQAEEDLNADIDVAFFDGLLEANHVVSKQEFDGFSQKHEKMADEMRRHKYQIPEDDKPLTETIFKLMEGFLTGFIKNSLSGQANAYIVGAMYGITDAIYRLTAESIKGYDENEEADIINQILEAFEFNRYSEETIKSMMKTRFDVSSDYYEKGQGIPIFQLVERIAEEIVEYYGQKNLILNYDAIRKSLVDYQISVSNAIQTQLAKQ